MNKHGYGYLQILKFALELDDKLLIGFAASKLEAFYDEISKIMAFNDSGEKAMALSLVESLLDTDKEPMSLAENHKRELAHYIANAITADEEDLFFEDKFAFMMQILGMQSEFLNAKRQGFSTQTQVNHFVDEELNTLKSQYLALQEIYANDLEQKEAILSRFDDFNRAYYIHLGEILQSILALQKLLAKKALKKAKNKEEKAQKQQIYEDIKRQEEEMKNHCQEMKKPKIQLNSEEEGELKKLFKRAVKLCHPDMIGSNKKIKLFHKLNQSYKEKDLQDVKNILWELESGWINTLEDLNEEDLAEIDNKQSLLTMIEKLTKQIKILENEIKTLKSNAQYDLVMNSEKWDEFFTQEKHKLEKELKTLQDELEQ